MDGIKHYLMDMDGVLLRGTKLIAGAAEFVQRLRAQGIPFLILTNNSRYIPRDLQVRLSYLGLEVPAEAIFTSALATAQFLHAQRPGGRAYTIGESGLTTALHDIGYVLTDQEPEYVVLGETTAYGFDRITRAIRFVMAGARFIATNPDVMGSGEGGIVPATGALAALISAATGIKPYFIGKPNPLMMRTALRTLDVTAQVVSDDKDIPSRIVGFNVGQRGNVALGIARGCTAGQHLAIADPQRPIDPGFFGSTLIVQRRFDAMPIRRPAGGGSKGAGHYRSQFIGTDGRRALGWLRVVGDDRRSFGKKSLSGGVPQLWVCRHLTPSFSRMRRIWLRLTRMPTSLAASASASRLH